MIEGRASWCDRTRKQRQCPIRLSNDDVFSASMALRTDHYDRLTAARVKRFADQLTRKDFIIRDELGYLPFAQSGGQLLFRLISQLYERASVIVTTNLAFGEWPSRCSIA